MQKIELTQGKVAIIDSEDLEKVSIRKWTYHHTGYVVGGYPQISLHRFIMGAKKGEYIDHKNGDKLDNRKSNLRFCTKAQNVQNTAPTRKIHKGVYKADRCNRWVVRVMANGIRHYFGYHKTLPQAIEVARKAYKELHGDFARI